VIIMILADLLESTGLDVLDHLETQVAIPVLGGLQAQGDLIVIPRALLDDVVVPDWAVHRDVPASGLELLRSATGGNPHTLVADPHTCTWTDWVRDPTGLAIGLLRATAPAYLIHPEHGGSGIAPGEYVIRRQRERGSSRPTRLIAD
jgi:hypothetical protein